MMKLILSHFESRHEDGSSSGKPVIVYFHGGSLFWGSARYDDFGPELFMDHDIILVQVNYRQVLLQSISQFHIYFFLKKS